MLVQDPLSGYLHEVPEAQPYYGGYGGGYYGGYDEYVDPSMAEYPGDLGFIFLPKIIRAFTRGGRPAAAPPPPPPPMMSTSFVPAPGMRAYIAGVVREVLAQTPPAVAQMLAPGGMAYRRRRRR